MKRIALLVPGLAVMSTPALAAADSSLADAAKSLLGTDPQSGATALRALAVLTVVSVVPSFVLLATSYPRILVVLSFLRRALGTQDLPPNQVLAGLTLLLTGVVMAPVWKRVHDEAYAPLSRGDIKSVEEAAARAAVPLKEFMLAHTLESDLKLFVELAQPRPARLPDASPRPAATTAGSPQKVEDLSLTVVLPAFVVSELKVAFQMGFLIFLPFLVIDLAVSAVLVSMGMFLMPPAMISLPLKVLVFVLADGWNLVVAQLVAGFQTLS